MNAEYFSKTFAAVKACLLIQEQQTITKFEKTGQCIERRMKTFVKVPKKNTTINESDAIYAKDVIKPNMFQIKD